ncbi:hypothetical protein FOZ63_028723 [Perkinsus olseni]|uniref:Chromosome segregation in meiosis protein 3 domain-containing protein n=1 Tax=Perkinsus olseni TaxID=32597 RepID=A0A7J6PVW3_PEROL|nr:hypothetical protein FOZ63_028723 [Perkinsus olseni]
MPTSPSASVAPGRAAAAAADDDDDVDMMDREAADDGDQDQQNMEEAGDEGNQDPTPAAAAPPKRKVNRRPKLTADRLLDDEHGLKCVMQDFEKSITFTGDTIRDLDTVILNYGAWAGRLYPYGMPLADFARTCETELYPEIKRRRIYDFRLDYVRRKGRFGPLEGEGGGGSASNSTAEAEPSNANEVDEAVDGLIGGGNDDANGGGGGGVENNSPPQPVKLTPEEMRLRMEANRLKALERRRLKEQQQQQHEEEQHHPQPGDGEQQQGGEQHQHQHHKSA